MSLDRLRYRSDISLDAPDALLAKLLSAWEMNPTHLSPKATICLKTHVDIYGFSLAILCDKNFLGSLIETL